MTDPVVPPQDPRVRRRSVLAALGLGLAGCSAPADRTSPDVATSTPGPAATTTEAAVTSAPPPPLAWGPTRAELEEAIAEMGELPIRHLAGQVIVARYEERDATGLARTARDLSLGGMVLLGKNVATLDQVVAMSAAMQEVQGELGRDWPALVTVDNEGGSVQRLSSANGPWTSFPAFAAAGRAVADGHPELVRQGMRAMARELRASGVTVNWAPVADVTVPGIDVTIGSRAAGIDPELVTATVLEAMAGIAEGGLLHAPKHFPGHGSVGVDTHHGLATVQHGAAGLEETDLVPFRAAVEGGAPMVMLGHLVVPDWDPELPATLSRAAYRHLREDLGFTGVTVTDGLDMGALTSTWTTPQIVVKALRAGADLLLSPTVHETHLAHAALVEAVKEGKIRRSRLEEAAGRVVTAARLQRRLAEKAGPVGLEDVGSARQAAAALWAYA